MDKGSVFLKTNHYQLAGDHFEKQAGQSYEVTNGSFTTCLCGKDESPSWSVRWSIRASWTAARTASGGCRRRRCEGSVKRRCAMWHNNFPVVGVNAITGAPARQAS